MGLDANLINLMNKMFCILCVALLLPLAALAEGNLNKQIDKTSKETPDVAAKHGDGKQDRPEAMALDQQRFEFVRTNLISTFYHEFAHALIDILELPVLGQEEDAADVFSVLMVDRLFDESEALAINGGGARGFQVDAAKLRGKGREWNWADEHGPDMQRYYNIVCLTYGGAPGQRAEFAKEMNLPDDRAELCEDEFELANNSWAPIIKRLESEKSDETVGFRQTARTALQLRAAEIIAAEVKTVNDKFNLPKHLRVRVKRCAQDGNFYAFYSSSRQKITICTNYIDELYRDAPK